jgi:uncharacterized membrane protein HdeD (DUF308 family)
MSTDTNPPAEHPLRQELEQLQQHWLLLFILGIAISVVGSLAVISSFIATLATVTFFGMLLLIGAIIHLVSAVTCRNWRGFLVYLLMGVLYGVVGLIMMTHPLAAAAAITLMLAAAFIAGGVIRIVVALMEHFHGWPWVMGSGFISLLLGIFIWRNFPGDALWVIGLFVGIDLIFLGWSWIILAIGIRNAFVGKA